MATQHTISRLAAAADTLDSLGLEVEATLLTQVMCRAAHSVLDNYSEWDQGEDNIPEFPEEISAYPDDEIDGFDDEFSTTDDVEESEFEDFLNGLLQEV